jgi:hypothetical protein
MSILHRAFDPTPAGKKRTDRRASTCGSDATSLGIGMV